MGSDGTCARLSPVETGMLKFLLWLILLVAYPFVWLLLLPFRLLGIVVEGVFDLLRTILTLPGRLLSGGPRAGL